MRTTLTLLAAALLSACTGPRSPEHGGPTLIVEDPAISAAADVAVEHRSDVFKITARAEGVMVVVLLPTRPDSLFVPTAAIEADGVTRTCEVDAGVDSEIGEDWIRFLGPCVRGRVYVDGKLSQ